VGRVEKGGVKGGGREGRGGGAGEGEDERGGWGRRGMRVIVGRRRGVLRNGGKGEGGWGSCMGFEGWGDITDTINLRGGPGTPGKQRGERTRGATGKRVLRTKTLRPIKRVLVTNKE